MPVRPFAPATLVAGALLPCAILTACSGPARTVPAARPTAAASISAPSPSPSPSATPLIAGGVDLPDYWRPRTPVSTGGTVAAARLPRAASLTALLDEVPAGRRIAFGGGRFTFADFAAGVSDTADGFVVPADVAGLVGAGVGRTVFSMTPRTSTHAAAIPTAFPDTNQLSLMAVTADRSTLSGFTLAATDQGHLYNGLRVHRTVGLHLDDVRVAGIPGSSSSPPGETFGVNDYRTTGSVYTRLEVDGKGVGASGFGANGSDDVTLTDSYLHGNPHSMGAAFWQVHGIRVTDVISVDNRVGFNFERVTGDVVLTRPVMADDPHGDIRIASDTGSADYTIVDPVIAGSILTVVVPRTYYGRPNLQDRSHIRLIVHGRDRTSELLRIVTGD